MNNTEIMFLIILNEHSINATGRMFALNFEKTLTECSKSVLLSLLDKLGLVTGSLFRFLQLIEKSSCAVTCMGQRAQ